MPDPITTWVQTATGMLEVVMPAGGGTGTEGPPGPTGPAGATGSTGATGAAGVGVPSGGTTGQVLAKTSGTDYVTGWTTPAGGPTAWVNVSAFANSWVNFGVGYPVARYRMIGDMVFVEGLIKSGTIGATPAFTLPVGFRPPLQLYLATQSNGAYGSLRLDTNGNVCPNSGSNVFFSVHCSFSTI